MHDRLWWCPHSYPPMPPLRLSMIISRFILFTVSDVKLWFALTSQIVQHFIDSEIVRIWIWNKGISHYLFILFHCQLPWLPVWLHTKRIHDVHTVNACIRTILYYTIYVPTSPYHRIYKINTSILYPIRLKCCDMIMTKTLNIILLTKCRCCLCKRCNTIYLYGCLLLQWRMLNNLNLNSNQLMKITSCIEALKWSVAEWNNNKSI